MNRTFGHYLSIALSLFFLVLLSQCAVFNRSGNDFAISGVVTDKAGMPLKDIGIKLLNNSGTKAITGKNGSFGIANTGKTDCILELTGKSGSGRIFIPADSDLSGLKITYPVIEKIVILHNNDQHFNYTLKEELKNEVANIEKQYKDVYYFNAGDIFVRYSQRWMHNDIMKDTAWYISRSKFMIENLNELGCDLLVPGNHELDYVSTYTMDALKSASFPVLAANIAITTGKLPVMQPFLIFETSTDRKIAVIGLTSGNRKEGIGQQNVDETIKKYLYLKEKNDLFIAVTHLGLARDTVLANLYPQFDIIIGGHSHSLLNEGLLKNNVLVAQAGGNDHLVYDANPNYLGIITITLENGKIADRTSRVIKFSQKTR